MNKIHKCNVANQSDHLEMLKRIRSYRNLFSFRETKPIYMHTYIHIQTHIHTCTLFV